MWLSSLASLYESDNPWIQYDCKGELFLNEALTFSQADKEEVKDHDEHIEDLQKETVKKSQANEL